MAQVKRDYPKLAEDIIREVGGKENIIKCYSLCYKTSFSFKENT